MPLSPYAIAVERAFQQGLRARTELPRGGHLVEREVPDLLAEDLRAFFGPLR